MRELMRETRFGVGREVGERAIRVGWGGGRFVMFDFGGSYSTRGGRAPRPSQYYIG